MTAPELCGLAEFARRIGASGAYVARLAKAGRLVLAPDGRVAVGPSLDRLAAGGVAVAGAAPVEPAATDPEPAATTMPDSYTAARALRERYLALAARRDYLLSIGTLAPKQVLAEVLARACSRMARLLDTIPGEMKRASPHLTADDLDVVRRVLAKVRNIAAATTIDDLEAEAGEGAANRSSERSEQPPRLS